MRTTHSRRVRARQQRRRQQQVGAAVLCTAACVTGLLAYLSPATSGDTTRAEKPAVTAALFGPGAGDSISTNTFDTVLEVATDTRQHLLVGPLTSGDAAASARMIGEGEYDVARAEDLKEKQNTVRRRFEQLATSSPGGTAMDGLHALDQRLVVLPHSTTDVVIVGDVLHVSPEVDLNNPIHRGDPEASLDTVAASGLLPHCEGWRVHIVAGIALVRDSQLDIEAREFWRRLLERCGGQLTLWDTAQLAVFPSTTAVPPVAFAEPCEVLFTLAGDVLFASGEWDLQPAALPMLEDLLANLATTHPDAQVFIDGYTDSSGGSEFDNYELSNQRVMHVRQWLVDHGVAPGRLTAKGHGPEDPVASNDTAAGRQLNRRVEIRLHLSPTDCPNQ